MTRGRGWVPPDPFRVVQAVLVALVLLCVVYSVVGEVS